MCILVVVKDRRPGVRFPFVLIHSREEDVRRPTAGEPQLDASTGIYAVRDQRAGGTWMGFNARTGMLVALTNRYPQAIEQRLPSLGSDSGSRAVDQCEGLKTPEGQGSTSPLPTSRGLLVIAALLQGTLSDDPLAGEALKSFSTAQRSTLLELIPYFSETSNSSRSVAVQPLHCFQGFNLLCSRLGRSALENPDVFVAAPAQTAYFEGDFEGPFALPPVKRNSASRDEPNQLSSFGITNTVPENAFEPRIALLKEVAEAELRRVNDAVAATLAQEAAKESVPHHRDDFLANLFQGVLSNSSDPSKTYPAPPLRAVGPYAFDVAQHDITKPVFVPIAWHQERFRLLLASGVAGQMSPDDQAIEKLSGTRAQTIVLVDRMDSEGKVLYCNRVIDWTAEDCDLDSSNRSLSSHRSWRHSVSPILTKEFELLP